MNEILVIHPRLEEVKPLAKVFKGSNYNLIFSKTFSENKTYIKNHSSLLVFLSTDLDDMDCLECLKKNKKLLNNITILINFSKTMDYILDCLSSGAIHFFDMNFNDHELKTLVKFHFKKYLTKDHYSYLIKNIVSENKEMVLSNYDIYNSDRIDIILDYITASIKPLFDKDLYIGISNAIYEILVNAMEHGNLGITSDQKEELLSKNTYNDILVEKIRKNDQKVYVKYTNTKDSIKIVIKDSGKGFDVKKQNKKDKLALCGRGIPIAKFFFDKVTYNKEGNAVTLVKKIENPE